MTLKKKHVELGRSNSRAIGEIGGEVKSSEYEQNTVYVFIMKF